MSLNLKNKYAPKKPHHQAVICLGLTTRETQIQRT